jgi:hypothetical protein
VRVVSADAPRLSLDGVFAEGTRLSWTSTPGRTYRIQYRNEFQPNDGWRVLGEVTATDAVTEAVDGTKPQPGQRFYQIMLVE